jgi:hypothetical protein
MSGIGSSLADLDKGVRKSVPGGWGTVAGLAAGGAGLYYGAGSAAAGAGANVLPGAVGSGTSVGIGTGGTVGAMTASSAPVAFAGGAAPAVGSALSPAAAMAVPGSAQAIYAAQTAANASGAANPFAISPRQALMANQMMGGLSPQQPQGGQQTSVGLRQGQAPNVSDPILALLAPKRKKKEPISLL